MEPTIRVGDYVFIHLGASVSEGGDGIYAIWLKGTGTANRVLDSLEFVRLARIPESRPRPRSTSSMTIPCTTITSPPWTS
jgi:hypothetical protein